jgi:hypothetical protein
MGGGLGKVRLLFPALFSIGMEERGDPGKALWHVQHLFHKAL